MYRRRSLLLITVSKDCTAYNLCNIITGYNAFVTGSTLGNIEVHLAHTQQNNARIYRTGDAPPTQKTMEFIKNYFTFMYPSRNMRKKRIFFDAYY